MPNQLSNGKFNQVSQAGPIPPMVFVCPDGVVYPALGNVNPLFAATPGGGNCMCRVATAPTDLPLGVSQVGFNLSPNLLQALAYPIGSPQYDGVLTFTQYAGNPGDQISISTDGDVCPIRLGVGGCTPGTFLTNDTAGLAIGIAPFTPDSYMGGVALEGGNAGEIIELYLLPGRV